MPRICEFWGVAIYMYYSDHAPPHFHAIYGGWEAVVLIEQNRLLRGVLPKRVLRQVLAWSRVRRSELLSNWQRAHTASPLEPIDPPQ